MIPPWFVAGAILMLNPRVGDQRADRVGRAIAAAVQDDFEAAAALVVNADGEASFRADVERCEERGIGGLGLFGLGRGYGSEESRCGAVERQARLALHAVNAVRAIVLVPVQDDPRHLFARYMGRRVEDREVTRRSALFTTTLDRIRSAACL
jgi:hypothetical protein